MILIIQVIALVCLAFEAFKLFQGPNRPVWGWCGMFLWLLSLMLGFVSLHTTYGAGH
jgi:hypothetical protein